MNNYLLVYPIAIILFFATVMSFTCTPFFTERQFPMPFYYLSEIEKYSFSYYLVFIWHFWIMSQSLVTLFLCFGIPILISMISTKLDILALRLKNIKNENQLKVWIQKHQKCIGHAKNINRILRFLVFKLYVAGMMTVIFGALPILYYNSTIELIRATLYVGVSLLLVYVVVWGADDMNRASSKISQEIFNNSDWTNMSTLIRKSMIIIMCRAQKQLDISIPGVLPALTLHFYAKFLSYALSYIMTLRAVLL
ncbi:uncharacterized protein [Chelonus insularis]|uniref:uncharacterized protein n=1 Tax=Chelonus insularis TaxID=460826 RepID=UPI00158F26B3|nr:uncharacterized protein LOC118073527 [Chelonus insularis]